MLAMEPQITAAAVWATNSIRAQSSCVRATLPILVAPCVVVVRGRWDEADEGLMRRWGEEGLFCTFVFLYPEVRKQENN